MPKMSSEPSAPFKRSTLNGPTMGTRWSVTVDADDRVDLIILGRCLAVAVEQVDKQMSPWKPDSDLMRLNRAPVGEWVNLSAEILEVLDCALEVKRLSAGAFDPCVGALVNAWGFGAVRDSPDAQAISAARQSMPVGAQGALGACRTWGVDSENRLERGQFLPDLQPTTPKSDRLLELDRPAGRARKHAPVLIDLCGIAKGYAVDRMTELLQQHGVRHALAALDGELRAVGDQANGAPWVVAIERPEAARRAVHGVIELEDLAVATSGDYRHYVKVGDAHLAHTMDARRQAPVNNGVASVTVLARTCMQADAWATALLVAGPDEGLVMAQQMKMDVLFLLRRAGDLTEIGLGRFGQSADPSNLGCQAN